MNSIDAVNTPAGSVSESGSIGLFGKADSFSLEDFKLLLAMSGQQGSGISETDTPLDGPSETSDEWTLSSERSGEKEDVSADSPAILFAVLQNYLGTGTTPSSAVPLQTGTLLGTAPPSQLPKETFNNSSSSPSTLPHHTATKNEFLDFLTAMELVVATSKSPSASKDLSVLQTWIQKLQGGEPKPVAVVPSPQESTLGADILATFFGSKSELKASTTDPALGLQPSSMPLASGPDSSAFGIQQPNAVTPSRQEDLGSMITKMVDRMMVGDSRFHSKGEIQMKLSDSILPQTELKLWRGEGGQLHVQFISQSAEASELLTSRLPLLNARLNEQFAQGPNSLPVQVSLNQDGEMPQDGRSRQRYEPPVDEDSLA